MLQGARICPRCSTRVDERAAKTSPYCLRCGAALGSPSATFAGKKPGGGSGSALPWILGGVGLLCLVGLGGVVAIVAVASADKDEARAAPVLATAGPKLETRTPAVVADAAPAVKPPPPIVRTPGSASTVSVVRTAATSAPVPPPPPPPPPPSVTVPPPDAAPPVGPFPRNEAQAQVDRVAGGLASCKRAGGPFGAGSIRIDFEPDGRVGTVSRAPFAGTPVGTCVAARFLSIRIGKFAGSTQRIEKTFIIQE